MLLYLRTSKGDINTQNTGNRVGELVDGSGNHYDEVLPRSLEPYEIRRAQVEELGNDAGNMFLAVKVRENSDKETDLHIGIDGSFYQRGGQRVLDVSDINSIIALACPFPVGTAFLVSMYGRDKINNSQIIDGSDKAKKTAQLLQNQYSGTTWTTYAITTGTVNALSSNVTVYGVLRKA